MPFLFGYFKPYGVTGGSDSATKAVFDEAIQKEDTSICDKVHLIGLGDITNREIRSLCYRKYAQSHPKQNICQRLIINAPAKDTVEGNSTYSDFTLCVNEEAKALNDASICKQIKDKDYQILCVEDVAFQLKDPSICKLFLDSSDQQKCESHLQD